MPSGFLAVKFFVEDRPLVVPLFVRADRRAYFAVMLDAIFGHFHRQDHLEDKFDDLDDIWLSCRGQPLVSPPVHAASCNNTLPKTALTDGIRVCTCAYVCVRVRVPAPAPAPACVCRRGKHWLALCLTSSARLQRQIPRYPAWACRSLSLCMPLEDHTALEVVATNGCGHTT